MSRDSILDDAERNREQNEDESESVQDSDTAATEDGTANETGDDRKRVTQRIPRDMLDDIDAVQERYVLPSRNAAINFILKHGTNELLSD